MRRVSCNYDFKSGPDVRFSDVPGWRVFGSGPAGFASLQARAPQTTQEPRTTLLYFAALNSWPGFCRATLGVDVVLSPIPAAF